MAQVRLYPLVLLVLHTPRVPLCYSLFQQQVNMLLVRHWVPSLHCLATLNERVSREKSVPCLLEAISERRVALSIEHPLHSKPNPTGYATSERRWGESPEKLAKTAEMCLPERKRVRKEGEEDDRSCRPYPGGPNEHAEHAILVW